MCRACYAVVVAPVEAQPRLRRAAGLDVQVVAMVTSFAEALTIDPPPDVIIVGDGVGDAPPPGMTAAIVVVGSAAISADERIDDGEDLPDRLPGAVVRALIARRGRS